MPLQVPPSSCRRLIRRSIDLCKLYRQAAVACEPGLRMVLSENAHTLAMLIADLQAQLRGAGDQAHERGSRAGWWYRRMLGLWPRDDAGWIRVLARHEHALLRIFEQSVALAPADAALILRRQLPRLRSIDLDMHSLVGIVRY